MTDNTDKLTSAIEELSANVVALTHAISNLPTEHVLTGYVPTSSKRRRAAYEEYALSVEGDMARVFDELYEEIPDREVTRAQIMQHFKGCENDEICQLIVRYDLTNCRSKGYRAFIDYARKRAKREKTVSGNYVLVGITMKYPKKSFSF